MTFLAKKMGAHATINPLRENLKERIWEETQNNGAGHIVSPFSSFFFLKKNYFYFFTFKNIQFRKYYVYYSTN